MDEISDFAIFQREGIKVPWIVNIRWNYVEDVREKPDKLIREQAKDSGIDVSTFLIRIDRRDSHQGLMGVTAGKVPRTCWIAAPLVAAAIGSGIVVLRLDEERYWVVVANEGWVLPGSDVLVPESSLYEVINRWHVDTGITSLYGDVHDAIQDGQWVIERTQEAVKNKEIVRGVIQVCVRKSHTSLIVLAGVAASAVLVFLFWDTIFPPPPPPATNTIDFDFIRKKEEEARIARIKSELHAEFEQKVRQMNEIMNKPPNFDVIHVIRNVAKIRGNYSLGIKPSVVCSGKIDIFTTPVFFSCTVQANIPAKYGPLVQAFYGVNPIDPPNVPQDSVFLGNHSIAVVQTEVRGWKKRISFSEKWQWSVWNDRIAQLSMMNAFSFGAKEDIVIRAGDFSRDGVVLDGVSDQIIGYSVQFSLRLPYLNEDMLAVLDFLLNRTPGIYPQLSGVRINETGEVIIDGAIQWAA